MAIYENKLEIGDKVVVTNKMLCFDIWEDMASVMEVKNFSNAWPNEREVSLKRNILTNNGYLINSPEINRTQYTPYAYKPLLGCVVCMGSVWGVLGSVYNAI